MESSQERFHSLRQRALDSPWLERVARVGYASKGLIYLALGGLSVQAALGAHDKAIGMRGTLYRLARQPFGPVLLATVAVGLSLYVLWRVLQATVDPEQRGTTLRGIGHRVAYAVSAVLFANLTWDAVEIIVEWSRGEVNTAEDWTALVLSLPLGRWLIGLVGFVIVGVGCYHLYEAYSARFRRKFKLDEMSKRTKLLVMILGRFGLAARGVVFMIVGVFLIVAALQSNAERAGGLGEALIALTGQPFGSWVMAALALGLAAYGLYILAEARYRWIVAR